MAIETLDDIVEELADALGVYGGCKHDSVDDVECTEKKPYCCRVAFSSGMQERIRDAVETEQALQRGRHAQPEDGEDG